MGLASCLGWGESCRSWPVHQCRSSRSTGETNRQTTHLDRPTHSFHGWTCSQCEWNYPLPNTTHRSRSQDRLRPPGRRQVSRPQMRRPPLAPRRRRHRKLHRPHPQTSRPRLQAQRCRRTFPAGDRPRIPQSTQSPGPGQIRSRRLPPPRPRRPVLKKSAECDREFI